MFCDPSFFAVPRAVDDIIISLSRPAFTISLLTRTELAIFEAPCRRSDAEQLHDIGAIRGNEVGYGYRAARDE